MNGKSWRLDEVPWHAFDPAKVDGELVKIVKAASMVEYNGGDYATYLCNVFPDDAEFQAAAIKWAGEEVQHGRALGRWAAMADPTFDFDASFARFIAGFRPPVDARDSVRGSRAGELVARCIVEVGTSSYYSALGEAAEEPLLREICKRIAADEFRHYHLFYRHLKRYLDKDRIGKVRRILVALGRITETEDDELAYAYYAANCAQGQAYDRRTYTRAYASRALRYVRPKHVERGVAMTFKAAGLSPQSRLARVTARGAYWMLRHRQRRLTAKAA